VKALACPTSGVGGPGQSITGPARTAPGAGQRPCSVVRTNPETVNTAELPEPGRQKVPGPPGNFHGRPCPAPVNGVPNWGGSDKRQVCSVRAGHDVAGLVLHQLGCLSLFGTDPQTGHRWPPAVLRGPRTAQTLGAPVARGRTRTALDLAARVGGQSIGHSRGDYATGCVGNRGPGRGLMVSPELGPMGTP
jgi:hypothetical protein